MCNLSRRVAIFGNCHQAEKSDHTEAVVRLLREAGMQVAVEREFLNFLREQTVHGRFFKRWTASIQPNALPIWPSPWEATVLFLQWQKRCAIGGSLY